LVSRRRKTVADEAEGAEDGGYAFGGGKAVSGHEEGEGEDAEEASDLAHCRSDAVAGDADSISEKSDCGVLITWPRRIPHS